MWVLARKRMCITQDLKFTFQAPEFYCKEIRIGTLSYYVGVLSTNLLYFWIVNGWQNSTLHEVVKIKITRGASTALNLLVCDSFAIIVQSQSSCVVMVVICIYSPTTALGFDLMFPRITLTLLGCWVVTILMKEICGTMQLRLLPGQLNCQSLTLLWVYYYTVYIIHAVS